ncbi:MAG: hypothetical protein ACC656_14810, partial [Candidatus Heimdallarchaeota archaeon]
ERILHRLKQLQLDPQHVRLIFDKGNICKDAIKGIVKANLRFICSVRPSTQKDLQELFAQDFELQELPNGKKVGIKEFEREFHGSMLRLIVCFNPKKQIWTG